MDAIFLFYYYDDRYSAQISTKGSLMVLVTINFKFIAFIAFRTWNEFADDENFKKRKSFQKRRRKYNLIACKNNWPMSKILNLKRWVNISTINDNVIYVIQSGFSLKKVKMFSAHFSSKAASFSCCNSFFEKRGLLPVSIFVLSQGNKIRSFLSSLALFRLNLHTHTCVILTT